MSKLRIRKAKLLAHPSDWVWCFGFGLIAGMILAMVVTGYAHP